MHWEQRYQDASSPPSILRYPQEAQKAHLLSIPDTVPGQNIPGETVSHPQSGFHNVPLRRKSGRAVLSETDIP